MNNYLILFVYLNYSIQIFHLMQENILKRILKIIAVIAVLIGLVYLAYVFADIIILLVISILLSFIFDPVVNFFQNKGLSRTLSIVLILAVTVVILFFTFSFLFPKISMQIERLASTITQENIKAFLLTIDSALVKYVPFIKHGQLSAKLETFFSSLFIDSLGSITDFLSSMVSVVAVLVIVPFMTFFLLRDNKEIKKGILTSIPNKYFEPAYWLVMKISIQLGRFVRGWIFDAFLVGFLSAVGLGLLGIENAIPIGIIAGIGHLIPYFGPIIGGIPAIIISIIQFGDFSMLPKIVILFIIIYTIDNGFIQPNVFAKSVDMHPLVIILLIAMGSQIFGVWGMLLAVPAATVLRTAIKELYFAYKNYGIIKL